MLTKISFILVLFIGFVHCQEQRFQENDLVRTLRDIGQEISRMTENAFKAQLASDLGISESLFTSENKTEEIKKAILEHIVDGLNEFISKHRPNSTVEDYSNLSIHEKVNLLVDNAVEELHKYLWKLITSYKEPEESETSDRQKLEKEFEKLVLRLFHELDELIKNGKDLKNLEKFTKTVDRLGYKLKKLAKKYEYYQYEDKSKLKEIKQEFGKVFGKLIKEIEEFLHLNKNATDLDSFRASFAIILRQVEIISQKIEALDNLEEESSEQNDEEKKEFLAKLKSLVENVDKFFDVNDYNELKEHKTKLHQLKSDMIKVYLKGLELKNSTEKHKHIKKKLKLLEIKFAKLVREYLTTIESFFTVNSQNVYLLSTRPDFDAVKESLEKVLSKILHKHDDSSEEEDEKKDSKEEDKREEDDKQPDVGRTLLNMFKEAGKLVDQAADDVFDTIEESFF